MAVVSPIAMHPTITEHDYRFPRRPDPHRSTDRIFARMDSQDGHVALTNGNAAAAAAMTSGQPASSSKNNILNAALFDGFQKVEASSSEQDDDFEKMMQSEDPLAAQIWKFFTRTKQQLPNQQRMENLTWRMMALNLRRRQQQQQREQQQQKTHNRYYYIFLSSRLMPCHVHLIGLSFLASMSFNRLDMAWLLLWGGAERVRSSSHHPGTG